MPDSAEIPVVFIHGLWMHSDSWTNWIELFNANGYRATAPGWPGDSPTAEATRKNPDALANRGLAEITDHFSTFISDLPATPVLVGHSFGGLIAQRLLGTGFARACVAIAPAQFRGVYALPPAQLRSAWPVLGHPRLRTKAWSHTPETFHRSFANGVSREESDQLLRDYGIPAPTRPLFQAALANVTPRSQATVDTRHERGPLLLIAGSADRTVPAATVRAAHRRQRGNKGVTEYKLFQERGHSLAADHGWRNVADYALSFLSHNGLTASDGPAPAP